MSDSDFRLPTPDPSVVLKRLDEGMVLLSAADDVYFSVNPVGARIWALLPPATKTFEEMCAVLASEYSDVTLDRIRRDARKFLDDIVASRLASRPSGVDPTERTGLTPKPPGVP